jgi:hypothetical protein
MWEVLIIMTLVGKYATGVKENVVLGTVYTDGR